MSYLKEVNVAFSLIFIPGMSLNDAVFDMVEKQLIYFPQTVSLYNRSKRSIVCLHLKK